MRPVSRTFLLFASLLALLASAHAQSAAPSPGGAAKGYRTAGAHEAAAAKAAPAQLETGTRSAEYHANQEARCSPLSALDKQACLERVGGRSTAETGSVQGGGILRETVTTVPADAP